MKKTVIVDDCTNNLHQYKEGHAVVVVDVICTTTVAVTSVASGRRCIPVPSVEDALSTGANLANPLFVGEWGGAMPYGFDVAMSPAAISRRRDLHRPVILLSSVATRLICEAGVCDAVFLACFRNVRATAAHLIGRYNRVALLPAASRGEFSEENMLCCAWIAGILVQAGHAPQDARTEALIEEWAKASPAGSFEGKSAKQLRKSGRNGDLSFILNHIDDIHSAFMVVRGEVVEIPAMKSRTASVWRPTRSAISEGAAL